jgi:hypothetical protein
VSSVILSTPTYLLQTGSNASEPSTQLIVPGPVGGNIVYLAAAVTPSVLPAGTTRTFTVRLNGVATGASTTIVAGGSSASWTGSVAYTAGQFFSVETTATGPITGFILYASVSFTV